ncbi:SCO1664 family protein [SAR202 cluster bacterium AD-802-E10_MRT_200m]|nr:SCO1664 family protein [SAR202 cluster bacterium AD-802-E10_MRT_200m]
MPIEIPENILDILRMGDITSEALIPIGSNYTFLVNIKTENGSEFRAIYKPRIGEAPLRDFPNGTLCLREYAAFVIANGLGWNFVPATVIREGPYGIGSIQLFIEHFRREHYFTLLEKYDPALKQICLFDLLINNADRKGGHLLLGTDNLVWGIDHGLTFHSVPKLRTVIWDFAEDFFPDELIIDMEDLLMGLESASDLLHELKDLLTPMEIQALRSRIHYLLANPRFPNPYQLGGRAFPWPLL